MNWKNQKGRNGNIPALPRRAEETYELRALLLLRTCLFTSCGLAEGYFNVSQEPAACICRTFTPGYTASHT
jgi:hypothetical protein